MIARRPDLDTKIQAAVSAVLSDGYRTADIVEPGTRKRGPQESGEVVVAAVKRLPH